jgi:hypothetical protein
MDGSGFYEAGRLKQVAINLFYGWGYNFYRKENQLRSDDQIIRAKASGLLGDARASIEAAETVFRRAHLSPPTRANPLPDPAAVAGAQVLEGLVRAVDSLIGRLSAVPTPSNDRMTERYRKEDGVLADLLECDVNLIGPCELLRRHLDGATPEFVLANRTMVEEGVAAIERTLRRRADILRPGAPLSGS